MGIPRTSWYVVFILRKVVHSPLCNFCQHHEQSIIHLFYQCDVIKRFWNALVECILDKCQHCHNFTFEKDLILFGIRDNIFTETALALIILLAKYYFVYTCKIRDVQPSVNTFMVLLKNRYKLELYTASITDRCEQFKLIWRSYTHMIGKCNSDAHGFNFFT